MKIIPIITMLISMGFSTSKITPTPHSNVVAHILIDNYNNDLYAKVYLEKSHFSMALKKEESCSAQEMLSVCGNSYFKKHMNLSLNGKALSFKNQSLEIQKDYVIYRYFLGPAEGEINTIEIEGYCMLQYDDHSVTKLKIKIDEHEKHYSLSSKLKKITLSLK